MFFEWDFLNNFVATCLKNYPVKSKSVNVGIIF